MHTEIEIINGNAVVQQGAKISTSRRGYVPIDFSSLLPPIDIPDPLVLREREESRFPSLGLFSGTWPGLVDT